MAKYLDPKTDITFKKIFGEHEDLIMSLLNALLPLPEGQDIVSLEYQKEEILPDRSQGKNSLVDVRCKDSTGRVFLVEMQMYWTSAYFKRTLFNVCKAYSKQIEKGDHFREIMPVYSLNILNDKMPDTDDNYRHVWKLTDIGNSEKTSDEICLTFIELPKFKPADKGHRKLTDLWLMFLTEVGHKMQELPEELAANSEILKAAEIVEECSYSEEALRGYETFWDRIMAERTDLQEWKDKGHAEGRAETLIEVAQNLKSQGISAEVIAKATGLTFEEIEKIK